jgi:hypothetical protein
MALNVYLTKEEIPDGMTFINKNDIYFDGFTNLDNSDFVTNVLREVDEAEVTSELTFLGRTKKLGNLFKDHLSTGSKTLINIHAYPEICFNVVECGDNALEFLCDLHEGNIYWHLPFINFERDDESCDIQCRGRHFDNMIDFLEFDWED